jgi:hypothetical protein
LIEKESVGIAGPFGYIHSYRGLKKVIPIQTLNDGGDVQTRLRADGEPCDVCGLFLINADIFSVSMDNCWIP